MFKYILSQAFFRRPTVFLRPPKSENFPFVSTPHFLRCPLSNGSTTITGELTIQTAAEWRAMLLEAVRQNSASAVNLSGVTKCDAAGLQLLCSLRATAPDLGITGLPAAICETAEALGVPLDSWASEEVGDARI